MLIIFTLKTVFVKQVQLLKQTFLYILGFDIFPALKLVLFIAVFDITNFNDCLFWRKIVPTVIFLYIKAPCWAHNHWKCFQQKLWTLNQHNYKAIYILYYCCIWLNSMKLLFVRRIYNQNWMSKKLNKQYMKEMWYEVSIFLKYYKSRKNNGKLI